MFSWVCFKSDKGYRDRKFRKMDLMEEKISLDEEVMDKYLDILEEDE